MTDTEGVLAPAERFRGEWYRGADGRWRWRVKAGNGRIVADSGEGYSNKQHVAALTVRLFPGVPFTEVSGG